MIPADTTMTDSGSMQHDRRESLRTSHYVIDSQDKPDPGQPRRPAEGGNQYCVPGFSGFSRASVGERVCGGVSGSASA